jgi:hypothetical protein
MPAWTAPVSHQKRPERNATNAVGIQQNRKKINELEHYLAAQHAWHDGGQHRQRNGQRDRCQIGERNAGAVSQELPDANLRTDTLPRTPKRLK